MPPAHSASHFEVLDAIKAAIERRLPISFNYVGSKTPGPRGGNPHAVFVRRKKDGTEDVYVHLWQTGGVTDPGWLPAWRMFFLAKCGDVEVGWEGQPFDIADGYNPGYYDFPLAKV
jgi:hypothetical protein